MVCDSNIIIDYLNGDKEIVELLQTWQKEQQTLAISSITTAEVLALPTLTPADAKITKKFLSYFLSIPLDDRIAEQAAIISRRYRLKLPDSAIAATALSLNIPLVTRDSHFKKVKELELVVP